jgi:hypothetical protein
MWLEQHLRAAAETSMAPREEIRFNFIQAAVEAAVRLVTREMNLVVVVVVVDMCTAEAEAQAVSIQIRRDSQAALLLAVAAVTAVMTSAATAMVWEPVEIQVAAEVEAISSVARVEQDIATVRLVVVAVVQTTLTLPMAVRWFSEAGVVQAVVTSLTVLGVIMPVEMAVVLSTWLHSLFQCKAHWQPMASPVSPLAVHGIAAAAAVLGAMSF